MSIENRDVGPFYTHFRYAYLPVAINVKSLAVTGKTFCYSFATECSFQEVGCLQEWQRIQSSELVSFSFKFVEHAVAS